MSSTDPILRIFDVRAKPGCGPALLEKFAVTSAAVVEGEPGNMGYFFGEGAEADSDLVMFTSVWESLDAVKARFGATWQQSFLPEGYEDLIEACSVRHIAVGSNWKVKGF